MNPQKRLREIAHLYYRIGYGNGLYKTKTGQKLIKIKDGDFENER